MEIGDCFVLKLTSQTLLLQNNGQILVAGGANSSEASPPAMNDIGFAVTRVAGGIAGQSAIQGPFPANPTSFSLAGYTSSGVLDPSFGAGGIVITPVTGATNAWISGEGVQADGKDRGCRHRTLNRKKGFTYSGGYVLRYLGQ